MLCFVLAELGFILRSLSPHPLLIRLTVRRPGGTFADVYRGIPSFAFSRLRRCHRGQDFAVPFHDRVVVSAAVRVHAAAAVFVSVFKIFEISAASVAEHVERAVAEQAVKVAFVGPSVARIEFAFAMGEVFVFFRHVPFASFPIKMARRRTTRHTLDKQTGPLYNMLPVPAEALHFPRVSDLPK